MMSRISLVVCALALTGGTVRAEEAPPPAPEAVPAAVPMAPPPPEVSMAPLSAPPAPAWPPSVSFKSEASSGNTLRVGLLLQPQFQMLGSNSLDGNTYNFFIRRTRLLVAGTLFGNFEYFIDTDYPNLFLATNEGPTATADATTTKATPGMNIQDAFATWKAYGDMIKVDVGYMLPPMAHNAVQGAGTLYSWDYFAFLVPQHRQHPPRQRGQPGRSRRGRSVPWVSARRAHRFCASGYSRGCAPRRRPAPPATRATTVGSNNFFRATGRLQINLLDPEPGFFYAGTYLGKKKILSFGITGDTQKSYHYYGGDVFADLPLGPGIFTGQVDVVHMTGGTFIALAKQTALMSEVGYTFDAPQPLADLPLRAPVGRDVIRRDHQRQSDACRAGPGLLAVRTRLEPQGVLHAGHPSGSAHGANQVNVQWQLYFL